MLIDSIHNPDNTFQTNVQGSQNVLDSCKFNAYFKNYCIFFTAAVYQNSDISVDEDQVLSDHCLLTDKVN